MEKPKSYYPTKDQYKCVRCKNQKFTSWNDFENHHAKHAVDYSINHGLPVVRLNPLKLKIKIKKGKCHVSSHTLPEISKSKNSETTSILKKLTPQNHKEEASAMSSHDAPSTSPDISAVTNSEQQPVVCQTSTLTTQNHKEEPDGVLSQNVCSASSDVSAAINTDHQSVACQPSSLDPQNHEHEENNGSTEGAASAIKNIEQQSVACPQSSNEQTVAPASQEEVLGDVAETPLDIVESQTALEVSPEPVPSPSDDPLGLSKESLPSTNQADQSDQPSNTRGSPQRLPAANTYGNIRVLPFESMVSPSVAKAGRHLLSTPFRAQVFENVAMVAIPEENLSDLAIDANKLNTENDKDVTAELPEVSGNQGEPASSVPSASETNETLPPIQPVVQTNPEIPPAASMGSTSQQPDPTIFRQPTVQQTQTQELRPSPVQQQLPAVNPHPMPVPVIAQRLPTAVQIRTMFPPRMDVARNADQRPVALSAPRSQYPLPVYSAPHVVVRMNPTSNTMAPVRSTSVQSTNGNAGPAVFNQPMLRQHPPSAQVQHVRLQTPQVETVRPYSGFNHQPYLPRNPTVPVHPFPGYSAPNQQVPGQQARPSFVALPQRHTVPTMIAPPNQPRPIRNPVATTPTQQATPMNTQSQARPQQVVSPQLAIRSQSRPQQPVPPVIRAQTRPQQTIRAQIAIRSQRPQHPVMPTSVVGPNQIRPMAGTVRHPIPPVVPSGAAAIGDAFRQAAPAPVTGQISSSVTNATAAQKRPLVVDSGSQCSPTMPKVPRVTEAGLQARDSAEVTITCRATVPASTSKSIDLPTSKALPLQEKTVASLMSNPNITLLPSKSKDNTGNSVSPPKRSEPTFIDLTADGNPPNNGVISRQNLTCQVCNRQFNDPDVLKTHLVSHLRGAAGGTAKQSGTVARPKVNAGAKSKAVSTPTSSPPVNQPEVTIVRESPARLGLNLDAGQVTCTRVGSSSASSPSAANPSAGSNASQPLARPSITTVTAVARGVPSPATAPVSQDVAVPSELVTNISRSSGNDLVVPLIDVTREGALQNLETMGITQFIPVSNLTSQSNHQKFVIPIMNVSSLRNPSQSLTALPNFAGVFQLGAPSSSDVLMVTKNSS